MIRRLKEGIKLSPRLQPGLYQLRHFFEVLSNRKCFVKNSERSNELLFIVGCGRSGNTLLRRLLMERFDIYIPPETYVLPRQINQYYSSTFLTWSDKVDNIVSMLENHPEYETFGVESLSEFKISAKQWSNSNQSFIDLIVELYQWIGKEKNSAGKWVGDKTPINTLSLGLLHWAFPGAKYIFLERDPVDVVQSYLKSGLYTNANDAAERWKKSLDCWLLFRKIKGDQDVFELRYEELVANPDGALSKIFEKFAIPERNEERKFDPVALGDVGAREHHSNVKNAPTTSSIGKGREHISNDDLCRVKKILGSLPESRGYRKL